MMHGQKNITSLLVLRRTGIEKNIESARDIITEFGEILFISVHRIAPRVIYTAFWGCGNSTELSKAEVVYMFMFMFIQDINSSDALNIRPFHLTIMFILFTDWILKRGSGMKIAFLNWKVRRWYLRLGNIILLFSIPLRQFRLLVTAVDLFSTVIIQTIPLRATHAAKHALSTNYELKCEPVFCPRLSVPEAPFFFALYDVRIRAAQLVRNKVLRETARGGKKTCNYCFNYPVILSVFLTTVSVASVMD